eukprot:CAMPEP_0180392984 /NCGR_PEP_ID=MMETSP0989-20121125/33482_1 /TAXON_ID=697907 /ORGANISM="non described non described, Strain CCMP2293" /LENGTH=72 /DNA_ID=CAMNT_0022394787 /DNA_START=1 /DNA_END=216 /DNA_ORIENTATION=+
MREGLCQASACEDRVLDGPASGGKGSKVGPLDEPAKAEPLKANRQSSTVIVPRELPGGVPLAAEEGKRRGNR